MKVAIVRLRDAGQLMNYQVSDEIKVHDYVIAEADRGTDYGEVVEIANADFCPKHEEKVSNLKHIIRKLSPQDHKKIESNKQEANDAMKLCSRTRKPTVAPW